MVLTEKILSFFRSAARASAIADRRCRCCLAPFSPDRPFSGICPDCRERLGPYAGPRCIRCGLPLPGPANGLCGGCLANLPPFGRCAYYGLYRASLRQLILRFKFHNEAWLSRLFGLFLLEASQCLPAPDALLAVPLHDARLAERGFNQANELARTLARLGGWPLLTLALRRHATGTRQSSLPAYERKSNVAGIFSAEPEAVRDKKLWLIDDIVTTGSTAISVSKALLDAGAAEINVLCVARTPRADDFPDS